MGILGRKAQVYRKKAPGDLSVNPAAGATETDQTPEYDCEPEDTVRVTYTFTSDANITDLKAQWLWYDKDGTLLSTTEESLTVNTTDTRTDEKEAPPDTRSMKFGIEATAGANAGSASFTDITLRLLVGLGKSITVSASADLVKEYCIGGSNPDQPRVLESGNKTFELSIDRLYLTKQYAEKILNGETVSFVMAPGDWATGNPLITIDSVKITSWELAIEQEGVITESISAEGADLTLETQS